MIGAGDVGFHERTLGHDARDLIGVHRAREAKLDRKAHRVVRSDECAAGLEERRERVHAGLTESTRDVRRLAIHAEELELVGLQVRHRSCAR